MNRENIITEEVVLPETITEAEKDTGVYTHTFSKPFNFEGKTYEKLSFNLEGLTGADSLSIENELAALGKIVVTPEFSGEYLIRIAVRACNENIGTDVFAAMPLRDYNKIRSKVRSFLMNAAL